MNDLKKILAISFFVCDAKIRKIIQTFAQIYKKVKIKDFQNYRRSISTQPESFLENCRLQKNA